MAKAPGLEFHEKLSDVTECSICADIFTNPKLLPCVHTFCLHCLEQYGKDKNPGDHMACPICRSEFVIPQQDFPANWETMKNEDFKTIQLKTSDQEYQDVAKAVFSTAQTTVNHFAKIERIQNKLLYKQYVERKAEMNAANPEVQNEMTLWQGARPDTLERINLTGFNPSYCRRTVGAIYGEGVYFSNDFSYSARDTFSTPDANGYKHVYQCKVLTGEYTVGNDAMIVPPTKSTAIKYDSTVENVIRPTVFVVYSDTQAYPEYLIYFK